MNGSPHLFLIDPVENLNLELDTSFRLAHALVDQGTPAFVATTEALSWPHSQKPTVHAQRLRFNNADVKGYVLETYNTMSIDAFATIHVRKDPPVDLNYSAMLWMLDSVSETSRIINAPRAIMAHNEKASIMRFAQYAIPTLISRDPELINQFVDEQCGGDAIIKPLDQFGGRGVRRITIAELGALEWSHPMVIQPFLPGVQGGEVRVFCAFGRPIAWCLKKPPRGSFMANTAQGATLHRYQPSGSFIDAIETVASYLYHEGLIFVGFDVIDGLISEINVTSPRLLQAPDDSTNYYTILADMMEHVA